MNFEEFQTNVHGWGEDRGIYEHSTILAQALKAVSECGELADAIIKGEQENVKDGIGDTAVCLVHVARMGGIGLNIKNTDEAEIHATWSRQAVAALAARAIADVALLSAVDGDEEVQSEMAEYLCQAFDGLRHLAVASNLNLSECLEAAWLEIKDRKGILTKEGAFVKDEEVTE